VWLFFEEAVSAALARTLAAYLLTETMERRPDLGFDSYDRFFPNQDTLPHGGFGNLIALPLQKNARGAGHSEFVDDAGVPHPDQWAFLSTIQRLPRTQLEQIVAEGERRGRILGVKLPPEDENDRTPWTTSPSRRSKNPSITGEMPHSLELVLGNEIYIAKDGLPASLRNRLLRIAAFQNPEFYKAQGMRLSTYSHPRIIACAENHPHHIGLPRGCLDELEQLLNDLNIRCVTRDERYGGQPLEVAFQGVLRPEQRVAANAMVMHDAGVLSATTAFGKTVVAAWLIAQRGVNTLVLVHRRQLLDQWVQRLSTFLNLQQKSIGHIGGGRRKPTGNLDVAVIQSLVRKGVVDDCVANYGHVIVDECHHVSAHSFEQVVRRAKARYILGLSATLTRKDGHHPIIFMHCGPVRQRVDPRVQAASRPFSHSVFVRPTAFQAAGDPTPDRRVEFQTLYRQLAQDEPRNAAICNEVVHAVEEGRAPLVLTERNEHLELFEQMLSGRVAHVVVLRGGMGKKQRQAAVETLAAIPPQEGRVILATGKYIGEGFDDPRLDTLFLTLPVSWRGTVAQYVGRLHRLYDGKREVRVYDYADLNVPMLARMFDRRCRGYKAVGYTIVVPASAIPGWPVDVPLPSDPVWKRDYAASVRRLVRDGVDVPLASLFVAAAMPIPSDAEGANRARSASEAFLYRRLETLSETRSRFRLNADLPIPFDGSGRMEVDLLCADARVVIEVDGALHLADPAAYRRDRRKDQLLQENDYLVLRFLAEDLGKALDSVLDTILRSLSSRRRSTDAVHALHVVRRHSPVNRTRIDA
jgi:superfamily II DNA or RNA helicase/very-short-patch-repair endonuclease